MDFLNGLMLQTVGYNLGLENTSYSFLSLILKILIHAVRNYTLLHAVRNDMFKDPLPRCWDWGCDRYTQQNITIYPNIP